MGRKMHIIQVTPRFTPAIGGVEEHVYRISLELVKRGHKVTVITSNEVDGQVYTLKKEVLQDIQIFRTALFMPRYFREIWFTPGIINILFKLKGDILHAHGYRCLSSCIAICLAKFRKIPTVLTPHGIYPPRSFINFMLKLSFDNTFGRLLIKNSDKIIALSKHNKKLLLQKGTPTNKITIIPNGVDLNEYVNLDVTQKNQPILLYVGRIDWNKRLDKVVEAMPLILKEFPSAKFVIVGPDYAKISKKILKLANILKVKNAIIITGEVKRKKLLEFYSSASIFIQPSLYEGFGLSMLEAMGSKIPVITSPYGGPGDILKHRVHALLLSKITPDEIFKSVHAILTDNNLRKNLVSNAFELVKKKYVWESVVDKLEAVYYQLINKNKRS